MAFLLFRQALPPSLGRTCATVLAQDGQPVDLLFGEDDKELRWRRSREIGISSSAQHPLKTVTEYEPALVP